MNSIEDIAKMAIEEVGAQLAKSTQYLDDGLDENLSNVQKTNSAKPLKTANIAKEVNFKISNINEQDENLNEQNETTLLGEHLFLNKLKERLEVLFAGLNVSDDNLNLKLDLTIRFLEFLLARVEERLEAITKNHI